MPLLFKIINLSLLFEGKRQALRRKPSLGSIFHVVKAKPDVQLLRSFAQVMVLRNFFVDTKRLRLNAPRDTVAS
jgi:hypothetical protein